MIRRAFVILFLCTPASAQETADPHTFLRRATLDIAGRLPTADEVRKYVKRPDPDRRVLELLASPEARVYHADLWMQWLLDHDFENRVFYRFSASELHAWLESAFDRPFGDMIRSLVTRKGPAGNFARIHAAGSEPPVKLALLNARLFLGRDIRCAQCHDHPSERLTHEGFWGFVSFFGRGRGGIKDHLGEVRAVPKYFDGREPEGEPLESLAGFMDWRPAIAERYWKLFMGRGKHPAEIEKAESPLELIRAIVDRPEYRVKKGPLKLMNSVQFMNAFADIFHLRPAHASMLKKALKSDKVAAPFKEEQVLRLFFHKWAKEMLLPKGQNPEAVRAHGTVRLALKFMNNKRVQNYFSPGWGLLRRVMARKHRPEDRVEELFLSVLGRPPTRAEAGIFTAKTFRDYEDIFWALVNSAEFIFVS